MAKPMLHDLSSYPFLVDLDRFLEKEGLPRSIEDLLVSRYAEIGFKRVIADIEGVLNSSEGQDYIEKILGFYMGALLASMTEDRRIYRRFSEAEAERVYRHLLSSSPEDVIYIISLMGYRVEKAREEELCIAIGIERTSYGLKFRCYSYKTPLPDYLRILTATGISDPRYRLVNRPVSKGYVYIESKEMLARICSSLARMRIEGMLKPRPVHEAAKPYVDEIIRRAREKLGAREEDAKAEEGGHSVKRYSWIEKIVSTGLPDGRKRFLLYVLTPYLATILKLEEEEALKIAREFLDNSCRNYGSCGKVYESWIRSAFKGAKQKGIKPARLEKLDEEVRKIIEEILSKAS
ncbi:MAG: DNA primase noncatalytic subunit PriX [Sulfolobales archaeon]